MTEQVGRSGDVNELDFTLRLLDEQERIDVQDILDAQLPGYVLADDVMQDNPRSIVVPVEDFSPSLAKLQNHYAGIAEEDAAEDDTQDLEQTVIDDGSELRLYPVRLATQSREDTPRPVVISWRDKLVVGFTSA